MVTIAMKMMAAVTAAFAVKYLLAMPSLGGTGTTDGINSMALQQGGLGLLLTTMIISAPPMAAAFFQGTLGQFNSYSPFGHIKPEPAGHGGGGYGPPGSPTYMPNGQSTPQLGDTRNQSHHSGFSNNTANMGLGQSYVSKPDEIQKKDYGNV
jgi:type IV secretion system protein VirB6